MYNFLDNDEEHGEISTLFYFLFAFHPCKFCKYAYKFAIEHFTKNLEMHCFKRRRFKVEINYVP